MPSAADILRTLNPLSWRGILLPYTTRRVGFQHANAMHKFNFGQEIPEPTGPKAMTFEYGVPARNGLSSTARYGNLFGVMMPRLLEAMLDKTPGPLYDPVYAKFFRCVPSDLSDETKADMRDGTDFTISFVFKPTMEELEQAQEFVTRDSLLTAAGAYDSEVEKVDWKLEEPPPQLVNPIQAIGGVASQVETGINKNLNGFEKVIAQCEDTEEQIDRVEDPKNFSLRRRSRRLRDLAYRARARSGDPVKRVVRIVTTYNQTISEAASNVGMSIVDFLKINTDLVNLTEIPANTPVNKYA